MDVSVLYCTELFFSRVLVYMVHSLLAHSIRIHVYLDGRFKRFSSRPRPEYDRRYDVHSSSIDNPS